MASKGLYTPEILAAAMDLSAFPWDEDLPLTGQARSRSCGSSIAIGLRTDDEGAISAIGIRPHACAVGQAAADVFARFATGRTAGELVAARTQIAEWLAGDGAQPDWPGIVLLQNARTYPARHGAILLAWDAAVDALGNLSG